MADKNNKGLMFGLIIAIIALFAFSYAVSGKLKQTQKEAGRLNQLVLQKDTELNLLSASVQMKEQELEGVKKELEATRKTLDAISAELDNARKDLENASKKIEDLKTEGTEGTVQKVPPQQ